MELLLIERQSAISPVQALVSGDAFARLGAVQVRSHLP